MKSSIRKSPNGTMDIKVDAQPEQKAELLNGFQKCQNGQCGCPTDEYKNIENINVQDDGDTIHITLQAKADVDIDQAEVEKCLDWMKTETEKG